MLVGDLADELLDDVLEGDDAGRPAVLVDDDRHLQALLAQRLEQRVEPHGLGHPDGVRHQRLDGDLVAPLARHGDRRLEVDDADDVVQPVLDDREPAEAAAPGHRDDVRARSRRDGPPACAPGGS